MQLADTAERLLCNISAIHTGVIDILLEILVSCNRSKFQWVFLGQMCFLAMTGCKPVCVCWMPGLLLYSDHGSKCVNWNG